MEPNAWLHEHIAPWTSNPPDNLACVPRPRLMRGSSAPWSVEPKPTGATPRNGWQPGAPSLPSLPTTYGCTESWSCSKQGRSPDSTDSSSEPTSLISSICGLNRLTSAAAWAGCYWTGRAVRRASSGTHPSSWLPIRMRSLSICTRAQFVSVKFAAPCSVALDYCQRCDWGRRDIGPCGPLGHRAAWSGEEHEEVD